MSQQDRQYIDGLAEQKAGRTQQNSQFQQQQSTDVQQFADRLGLDYAQMSQQDRQYLSSLTEQQAARGQQALQFGRTANQQDDALFEQQQARQQQQNQFQSGLGENALDRLLNQGQFDARQLQDQNQFNTSSGQNATALQQQLAQIMGTDASGNRTLEGTQADRQSQQEMLALLMQLAQNDEWQVTGPGSSSKQTQTDIQGNVRDMIQRIMAGN